MDVTTGPTSKPKPRPRPQVMRLTEAAAERVRAQESAVGDHLAARRGRVRAGLRRDLEQEFIRYVAALELRGAAL